MKPETLQRLRFSSAALLRAVIASSWFWEGQLPPTGPVCRNRRRLQRAALKAQDDPIGFAEKHIGSDWFTENASLPEAAAVALCEILAELAGVAQHPEVLREFVISEKSERRIIGQLLAFFSSLAARPGRPRIDIYRKAADLYVGGQRSHHKLCVQLEPSYPTMSKDEQRKARDRMRNGVARLLLGKMVQRTKLAL